MKILVVRFSSIGDVILTTPIVRCLHEQLPSAEIHFITKQAFVPLLENNPHIAEIIAIKKSYKEVLPTLKTNDYDVIVDLHNNVRTLSLKLALGKKSVTFPKKNIRKALLTLLKWDVMPKVHIVDRYFKPVEKLGVKNDGLSCELFLNESEIQTAEKALTTIGSFVAIAMGAQFATKQLPIELIQKALENNRLPVVLLGGPSDQERAELVTLALSSQQVINFCGKLSLRESAAVLRKANVLLTGDTGLMHIATCFSVPIVSVWGNTVPSLGMYPYSPKDPKNFTIHEVPNLPCRPCSKIGYASCPKKHFHCMMQQDTREIEKAIEGFAVKGR